MAKYIVRGITEWRYTNAKEAREVFEDIKVLIERGIMRVSRVELLKNNQLIDGYAEEG